MSGRHPEHAVRHPLLHMRWETVSFLHWSYDAADLAPLVPKGLELELFDDRAWVGLVSFVMAGVRPPLVPAVPGLSTFPEVNVRTYVRSPDGLDGLLFLTLEAAQPLTVMARPSIGIAYSWAQMSIRSSDTVTYTTRRRWPPQPAAVSRHVVRPGAAIADKDRTEFDDWLTGRWRAYSRRGGVLFRTPVEHEPWPLQRAELLDIDDGLIASCGLPAPSGEPVAHYSPGVTVRLGLPRRVP